MKGTIKANTVDKYLYPIRQQIIELIEPGATVVDLGCGNGDLLFKLSGKIQMGIGLDISEQLIAFASKRKENEKIDNLEFKIIDLTQGAFLESKTDYAVVSLLFHILPWEESIELLKWQLTHSETVIVCGFSEPKNLKQKMLLWIDQRFNRHYPNYKTYKQKGFTEGLLNSLENITFNTIDTFDTVIKIYEITKDS